MSLWWESWYDTIYNCPVNVPQEAPTLIKGLHFIAADYKTQAQGFDSIEEHKRGNSTKIFCSILAILFYSTSPRHWAWLRRGYWHYRNLIDWLIEVYMYALPFHFQQFRSSQLEQIPSKCIWNSLVSGNQGLHFTEFQIFSNNLIATLMNYMSFMNHHRSLPREYFKPSKFEWRLYWI